MFRSIVLAFAMLLVSTTSYMPTTYGVERVAGTKTVTVYANSSFEAASTAEKNNSGWKARKVQKVGEGRMYKVWMEQR